MFAGLVSGGCADVDAEAEVPAHTQDENTTSADTAARLSSLPATRADRSSGAAYGASSDMRDDRASKSVDPVERYRSITFSSRRPPESGTLEDLRELGVSHVTLIPFGYQRAFDIAAISFDPSRRWFTESDSGITDIARRARSMGMGTILKPHIWVGHYSTDGQNRHEIGFDSEEAWQAWERDYLRFILHYADLAQSIRADVFVVGTELAKTAVERAPFWRRVVEEVRSVYDGKLTYAANWYREYESVSFWSELDFIGVQAYFPLSDQNRPDVATLRVGWAPYKKALVELSERYRRPILFTEIGYRSVTGSAIEPWRWASRQEAQLVEPDFQVQADLYRAFFVEVWPQPWFAGASIWRWHTAPESRTPVRAIDFTPQNKPALDVLKAAWVDATD